MELEQRYNKKINHIQIVQEKLREINQACEYCNGTGRVLRNRSCAEDDRPDPNDLSDYIKCRGCNGTGLAHQNKRE